MGGTIGVFPRSSNASHQSVSNASTQVAASLEAPVARSTFPSFPADHQNDAQSISTPISLSTPSLAPTHVMSLDLPPSLPESPSHPSLLSQTNNWETPREDVVFKDCIPHTPTGEEAERYKYYCPLCMLHFQFILKVPCCKNYICLNCTKDFLKSKKIGDNMCVEDMLNSELLTHIPCPHCQSVGFRPMRVSIREAVRDYSYHNPPQPSDYISASPLKVGETFEDMKRKMVPFRAQSHSNSCLPATTAVHTVVLDQAELSDAVAGIAIEEDFEASQTDGELIVPSRSLHNTPSRDSESKEVTDIYAFSSAKSVGPLETSLTLRQYNDQSNSVQRLADNINTPYRGGEVANDDDDMFLADDKEDHLFDDKLSESNDVLEDTAAESTSMLFHHLNMYEAQHILAENMVGSIVQGFFSHPVVLEGQ